MKLRVEHTKLKSLLNESTYQDVFPKIKKGDNLIVKTGKQIYDSKVTDVFGNQITFQWNGMDFIITSNSFDGTNLTTHRVIKDPEGKVKTAKGPTVSGIYNIILKRNGQTIGGVSAGDEKVRPEKEKKKQEKTQKGYEQRFKELNDDLKQFDDGDVMEITTGKLVTKGIDSGSLAPNTITKIKLRVEKVGNGLIKTSLIDAEGQDATLYDKFADMYLFIGSESLQPTKEGINLILKGKSGNNVSKHYIKNVFGIENIGKFKEEPELSIQDLMNSPRLRSMMIKNPSLLDSLLGKKGGAGIIPLEKKLASLGLTTKSNKADKVKFKYYGEDIRPEYRFNFKNNDIYVGRYTKDNVIKRTGDNRRESMYIQLDKEISKNQFEATIIYDKIVDGKSNPVEVGTGRIKIIDTKF